MKRFYWFLFAVCLLSRRFRLKGKTPWDYGWEMAWNFFINAIFRLGIFCNSRWRLLILKGCPLRESIIGAAAGGIGHPRLAIGIWMSVWVEPWDFMTLTIRVFCSVWPAPALSAVISKCPDLFGGRLPSCDRSCDRRWTWRLLWSRILEFRIVRQIPFLKLWMIVIYS